jgi:hypothetical protein
VPDPSADVFHPANVKPDFANTGEPEFPKTATIDPDAYGEEPSDG